MDLTPEARTKLGPTHLAADVCTNLDDGDSREWLLADGLGGYASGTISGTPTRRYHGLLIDAFSPPADRRLLVHSVHERVTIDGVRHELDTNRWADGTIAPEGHHLLTSFELEGRTPCWTWCVDGVEITRRLALDRGLFEATWTISENRNVEFECVVLVSQRGHHQLLTGGEPPSIELCHERARILWPSNDGVDLHLRFDGTGTLLGDWWRGFRLAEETARGFPDLDDAFAAFSFKTDTTRTRTIRLHAGRDADRVEDRPDLIAKAHADDASCLERAGAASSSPLHRRLVLAADQFMVERHDTTGHVGRTIIAGYPWFTDWGRDTMLSLPGLALETGRVTEATEILRTFAAVEHEGLLPNVFDESGRASMDNTVDAPLLFIEAIARWHAVTGDDEVLQELWPTIDSILTHYRTGTAYGIGLDATDGLIHAGEQGLQLTWMDAKVGDRVITPRIGKPVEINALWFKALKNAAMLARRLGQDHAVFEAQAETTRQGFQRFHNPETKCLFDVLDGPSGDDPSIRPNQLFAIAEAPDLLPLDIASDALDVVTRELLVPMGLRTLDRDDPAFIGRYEGGPEARDGAYHEGTAWPWLIGPFLAAQYAVHGTSDERTTTMLANVLSQAEQHLGVAGVGSVSEILDALAPNTPRGCIAQAWSVAGLLDIIGTRTTKDTAP